LTGAGVLAENKLFATLDPTTRKLELPCGESVLLTDTVGFIRKLPHHLVKAFKSTLDEVVYADILLIVSDITDPEVSEHIDVTKNVIEELGASDKPIIYVANISEDEVSGDYVNNEGYKLLKAHADSEGSEIIAVSAQIEAELAELEGEEKQGFLEDLGIDESGLDKLIKSGYSLLGLISFLTAGPKEVRAWTIKRGTKAPGAAGKIHSDFERGFIRAEVVAFDDLVREGDRNKVKEKGLLRSEGKEYVMKDGDIVEFLFNV
jgi:ribosome-binding ATPase YchF (GTP1/OBG family)